MAKPEQGDLSLLEDPAAQRLLASQQVAHLAYNWTDGTPRCTPIWFHWTGNEVVMASPAIAPKGIALHSGDTVAVTIDDAAWPYSALMIRGAVEVDEVDGVAPEYRHAAVRYFGDEQGNGWCDQLPPTSMHRFRVTPAWVGVLDFDEMRRLTSSLATLMTPD
jgi:hypothetical protein